MNNGPLLFFGILATLASSFWGLLFAPQWQIGRQQPVVIEATGEIYPSPRPGLAQQGAEVYRAQGCAECHTRQVRQTGVEFDVWLTDAGTNKAELIAALGQFTLAASEATRAVEQLPAKLLSGLSVNDAQRIKAQVTNGGARAEAVLVALGPDIQRGWGKRVTVAQDFLHDYPVQLGNLRVGPDLANVGARLPTSQAILQKLYDPQHVTPGSMMPPYRYLFEKRPLVAGEKLPDDAVAILNRTDKSPGEVVTARPEAKALAAYLLSQRVETALTNAPASGTPSAASTNAPANFATNAPAPPAK
jgi:ribosomal protein L7/L12